MNIRGGRFPILDSPTFYYSTRFCWNAVYVDHGVYFLHYVGISWDLSGGYVPHSAHDIKIDSAPLQPGAAYMSITICICRISERLFQSFLDSRILVILHYFPHLGHGCALKLQISSFLILGVIARPA